MLRILSIILYIIGGIYFVLFAIFVLSMSMLFGFQTLYPMLPILTKIQLFCLGCWINSKNKIPSEGQYIIMMNHTSFADVFFSIQPLQGKYTAVLAAFNFDIPLWGRMLKRFNAVSVERKNKLKAIQSMKDAEHIINNLGYHIVIFPEGTRTLDGKLQRFKKGGFHMAINTQTPILPVVVKGGFEYKPKNRWYIKPGLVSVEVGEPISVDNFSIKNIDELVTQTHDEFKRLLK